MTEEPMRPQIKWFSFPGAHRSSEPLPTFTFRVSFYPERLTISTFVVRRAAIYLCGFSKDVHRTK